ncbi:nitrogen regulatory protein P-II [Flammeovirgaceae bacterium 311]|nr:nitrogen regulatory protein P-II [Flammeovirgaceae bacterium 311]
MKKVEAIIRTSKFEEVHSALSSLGIPFMYSMEVKGFGKEASLSHTYRGAHYDVGFIPRTKIEVVVTELQLDDVVECILQEASTGEIGDGKIFISDVERVIRIRSREEGAAAL